jgi:Lon protease-like protein
VLDDLPLFPLEMVLLPDELAPLHIFEPRYREMTARCLEGDEPFAIVLAQKGGVREVACTARIAEVVTRFPDGRSNIVVRGETPVRLHEVLSERSYHTAVAEALADAVARGEPEAEAEASAAFAELAATAGDESPPPDPGERLAYRIAARVDFPPETKQSLLEERDEGVRLRRVTSLVRQARRGLVISREVERRSRGNGRVRTADEIAKELGL